MAARNQSVFLDITTPPDNSSPAQVARLLGHATLTQATLFDLIRRKIVQVEQAADVRPRASTYILRRHSAAETPLCAYEQNFLNAAFQSNDSVRLADVAPRLAWGAAELDETLEAEMIAVGWLDRRFQQHYNQLLKFSAVATLVGATMIVISLVLGTVALSHRLPLTEGAAGIIIIATLASSSIVALVAALLARQRAAVFSTLSLTGKQRAARWEEFAAHLRAIVRGHRPLARPDCYHSYLPLAAACGLAEEWIKCFQRQGGVPQPAWLLVLARSGDVGDLSGTAALMSLTNSAVSGELSRS
jgi:hypothetical protein